MYKFIFKPYKIKSFIPVLFLFCMYTSSHIYSQTPSIGPDSYINAYFMMDHEAFSNYLSDDVKWSDPTWSEVDPNNEAVIGKEAFLKHIKEATSGISDMSYTIDHRFVSADYCVYEGTLNYSWTNANNQKVFTFSIREVTVLKLLDNQIIEHTDYADYKTWMTQYKSQL